MNDGKKYISFNFGLFKFELILCSGFIFPGDRTFKGFIAIPIFFASFRVSRKSVKIIFATMNGRLVPVVELFSIKTEAFQVLRPLGKMHF